MKSSLEVPLLPEREGTLPLSHSCFRCLLQFVHTCVC